MSENFYNEKDPDEDDYAPGVDDILSALDGDINAQGIKVNHRAWLDMGSEEWSQTSDESKANAYQASQITGWTDSALYKLISVKYTHLSDDVLKMTFETLRSLAKQHPVDSVSTDS